jgi:Tryptophan-associated transmembrane protein (Trp_oprn_chp)
MGCHDAPMSDARPDTPAPDDGIEHDAGDAMRLAGFGLTALGGLLIGVGALMPWIRSGLEDAPDELSLTYYGIDVLDGRIALAAAVVVLAGLAVARFAASPKPRRDAALAVIAGGVVALAVAGAAVLTAAERFESSAVEDIMATLPSGTAQELRDEVEELVEATLAPGPFAVLGGGILAVVGGGLLLAWVSRTGAADAPAFPDRDRQRPPSTTDLPS